MTYNTNEDMDGDHYTDNLHHLAVPSTPQQRKEAVSTTLEDYQALFLGRMLREWAAYHAEQVGRGDIARGYVEYINREVRQQEACGVDLYAHTPVAAKVLNEAIYDYQYAYGDLTPTDVFDIIKDALKDLWAEQHAETVNKDANRQAYDTPPESVEVEDPNGGTVKATRD